MYNRQIIFIFIPSSIETVLPFSARNGQYDHPFSVIPDANRKNHQNKPARICYDILRKEATA